MGGRPLRDLATVAVHGRQGDGEGAHRSGPVEPPLVLSSAFAFESSEVAEAAFRGESDALIYGRWQNPTARELEEHLAALEGGEAAIVTASGMAAVSGTMLGLLESGAHIVAPRALYGESARLFRERLPKLGITTTFIDDVTRAGYERATTAATRIHYVETPSNPTLAVTDIRAVAEGAHVRGLTVVVDNTFATPICQRPLLLGADVVIHSLTKGLSGHGDAIGGAVIASRGLRDRIADTIVKGLGGVLAPFNAFLTLRGLRTLALRVERAAASALTLAQHFEGHRAVKRVHYPGLESHPSHELARTQMTLFGAMVSLELTGGREACRALVERVKLITHAVSLGDVKTLVTHPASTTASTMPPADRVAAGITDDLIRLSVGVESPRDLIEDLEQALR
jgi:cystathionine beta-lyase/cystathionine gamma-synthase